MRIPAWCLIVAAVVLVLPLGWYLGVYATSLLIGPDVGVFPVLTIPVCIAAAAIFVIRSTLGPWKCLSVMAGGTGVVALTATFVPA
jgi:hypothetical protein